MLVERLRRCATGHAPTRGSDVIRSRAAATVWRITRPGSGPKALPGRIHARPSESHAKQTKLTLRSSGEPMRLCQHAPTPVDASSLLV